LKGIRLKRVKGIYKLSGNLKDFVKKFDVLLEKFGILEFVRSGRVAITKPMKTLNTFLKEVENNSKTVIKHFSK
jgi:hypothetical protein